MREITTEDIEDLAVGAAVLGTGGGGDPHVGKLMAQQAIKEHGPVELLDPDEVPNDALVIPSAMMGAPTVILEKLPEGREAIRSLERLAEEFEQEVYATMPIECGGMNSTIPFTVAARLGLPLVDADGMGRAFPELHHETWNVYGVDGTPAVISNEKGDATLFETEDNESLERYARAVTIEMGGASFLCDYPMIGETVAETSIPNTISLGTEIGSAIRDPMDDDPIESFKRVTGESNYGRAVELFEGKIVDVQRRTEGGFAVGHVDIDGLGDHDGERLRIDIQNENLIARRNGEVLASVPDLIVVLERETGRPVTTESLRYGYRVRVFGIPTPNIMRSDEALNVWGPEYFGYDLEYVELERRYPEYYAEHGVPTEKAHLLN
ncbi:DUF917 domain-containing protein [Halococcus sediminicola]|uniref:DUF917 domain-containing protein n=1 Tax=Halococcus sediminicola TaxID=1264579 RepID=UPI00067947AB|nr:DUF917 domain-containing protein [Halococcus sediminicola]